MAVCGRRQERRFGECENGRVADLVPPDSTSRRDHWDATYRRAAPTLVSWFQPDPTVSLELFEVLQVPRDAAVIDVGGGASTLVDELRVRGFLDVSVLDISEAALALARDRVGHDEGVQFLHTDVLSWRPARQYDLWHDRAMFHFLVDGADRQRYLEVLQAAMRPGGRAIIMRPSPLTVRNAAPACRPHDTERTIWPLSWVAYSRSSKCAARNTPRRWGSSSLHVGRRA